MPTTEVTTRSGSPGYSPEYVENAFLLWYAQGQPPYRRFTEVLEPDEQGHYPGYASIIRWADEGKWEERAEELNKKAVQLYEQEYVAHKAQMMARHAGIGRELTEKGFKWIESHEIKSAHAALRAIELGIEIERDASNLNALIETVSKMGDEKVMSKLDTYLSKIRIRRDAAKDTETENDA